MKSIIYIKWISVLCVISVSCQEVKACWIASYSPSEYIMYYPYIENNRKENTNKDNCELWQKHTSRSIPVEDISKVVYEYDVEGVQAILTDSLHSQNKFVQWIRAKKDLEIIDLLLLAKRCEYLRHERTSSWYYPSKKDSTKYNLQRVINDAKAYNGYRFKSRYALQAVRAMYTLGEYDDCCDYWAKIERNMPNDILRRMTMDYVAACELKRGNKKKARDMYAELDDWNMLLNCFDSIPGGDYARLEIGLKYAPNSESLMNYVAEEVRYLDIYGVKNWRWDLSEEEVDARYRKLLKICVSMAKKQKVENKTFWWYSASIIADKFGLEKVALKYVVKAENTCKNRSYIDKLKVLRLYITAKIMKCDSKYEDWLCEQIKWYEVKIKADVKEMEGISFESMIGNYSCCYWNDMMRKLVLGVAVPKLIKDNRGVFALQVANMADNYVLNLCGKISMDYDFNTDEYVKVSIERYREIAEPNEWDYSNQFFMYLNLVNVDDIITYVKVLLNPRTERDLYFAKRSYVDKDYLYDAVGTYLLRNMRYGEAEKYLREVTFGYQNKLNTKSYLNIDPFDYGYRVRKVTYDAKYEFAKEMRELEVAIKANKNLNRKAQLMLRYALGISKSFSDSWALTQYFRGTSWGNVEQFQEKIDDSFVDKAYKRARELEAKALSMITDNELAAYCYSLFYNYEMISTKYSHTDYAKLLETSCDNYKDYQQNKK